MVSYLSPRWLFQFQFLLRSGSFTEAAAQMQISQQALSKNIRALETWAGYALLNRQGQLRPTQQGQQLLDAIPGLMHALLAIDQASDDRPARFALGISERLPFGIVVPALQRGLAAADEHRVELLSLSESEIQFFLQAGELDMGLTLQPLSGSGWEVLLGQGLDWRFVASPGVLAQDPPYGLLSYGLQQNQAVSPELASLTRPVGEFAQWDLLKAMVLRAAGVACFPLPFVAHELASGTLQLCELPFPAFRTELYFTAAPAWHEIELARCLREQIGA